jgi:transcription initiation factor TFIIE subunit alpha
MPKITTKITEDVVSEVAGADVILLVRALKDKKNVSEFALAKMIKIEVNETRNMLYRLFNNNLVTFIRKKDKLKGWYIYYWTFNPKRIKYLMADLKKKKLERLKERLEREKSNHFFICKNRCIRLDFEQAMDFSFKCPECSEIMNQEENTKVISQIEKDITSLSKEMKA